MTDEGSASRPYADTSAALSIAKRRGAAKMRHINVNRLWLHEKEVQHVLDCVKVKGEDTSGRGPTKHVRQELAERCSKTDRLRLGGNRAKTNFQLPGQSKLLSKWY